MREMKDSGVEWLGEVPEEWTLRQAGQLAYQTKAPNEGMIETNLLSLSYGKVKRRDINAADGLLPASFETYNVIEPNDIVLRFTDLQNDQKSLRVGRATERGIITSAYVTVRPLNPSYSRFIYYALHAYDLRKGFYGMGAGVRQGLKWQEAKYIKLPWPDDAERDRITDFLDEKCAEIDRAVSAAEKSIEEYRAYQGTLIKRAIICGVSSSPKIKNSGISAIGAMNANWHLAMLKRLASFLNGDRSGNYPSGEDIKDAGVPFVTSADLSARYLSGSFSKYISRTKYDSLKGVKLQRGDIVFCLRGSVGKCSMNRTEDCGSVASSLAVARPTRCVPEWLNYALTCSTTTDQAIATAIGATSANLAANVLEQVLVPLPSLPEQRCIADYLDEKCAQIDAAIAAKQAIIADLKAYKQSLIFEAVTGKREV